jgi:hypothetical protein
MAAQRFAMGFSAKGCARLDPMLATLRAQRHGARRSFAREAAPPTGTGPPASASIPPPEPSRVLGRTPFQPSPNFAPQYTGLVDAAVKVVRQEGVRGLFRGISARMAVTAPSAAISWGTYEALKKLLGPITG